MSKEKEPMQERDMQKVTEDTAAKLKKQKKVPVRIYLSLEERQKLEAIERSGKKAAWPFETVQINGYTFQIQKGKDVEVPESVAKILRQANLV